MKKITIADADRVFGPPVGEIGTKLYGLSYTKFWTFWQKNVNHF